MKKLRLGVIRDPGSLAPESTLFAPGSRDPGASKWRSLRAYVQRFAGSSLHLQSPESDSLGLPVLPAQGLTYLEFVSSLLWASVSPSLK